MLNFEESVRLINTVLYSLQEFPRRSVGDKTAQVFNDEQVVAFDCAERLSGYQYVGMLDHDEFIIPSQAAVHTWKHLLVII